MGKFGWDWVGLGCGWENPFRERKVSALMVSKRNCNYKSYKVGQREYDIILYYMIIVFFFEVFIS